MDILETFQYRTHTVTLRGDAADEHGQRFVFIEQEDVSDDCVQDAEIPEWRERARMLIDAKMGPMVTGTYDETGERLPKRVVDDLATGTLTWGRLAQEAEGEEE